jgi:hypothetical protein
LFIPLSIMSQQYDAGDKHKKAIASGAMAWSKTRMVGGAEGEI